VGAHLGGLSVRARPEGSPFISHWGGELEELGGEGSKELKSEPLRPGPWTDGPAKEDEPPLHEAGAAERKLQTVGRGRRAGGGPDGAGPRDPMAEETPPVADPLGEVVDLEFCGVGIEGAADGLDGPEEDRVL